MKIKRLILIVIFFISQFVFAQSVGIGSTSFVPGAMLEIHGIGATNATQALHVENSAGTDMVTVLNNGNVGIGTATPYQKMHIYGTAAGAMGPRFMIMNSAGGAGAQAAIDLCSYDPGAGNDPTARILVDDNNWSSHLTFSTKTEGAAGNTLVEHMRVTSGGNVGIGTTTVNEKLHIHGNVYLPTSTTAVGVLVSNGSRYIHNFGTQNFFAGVGSGRLHAGATGTDNVGVGYNVYSAYTSGTANTFIGSGAGTSLTASNQNTAIGYGALSAITDNTMSSNTAIGYIALQGTTSAFNTAIGHSALSQGNTGGYNTSVGYYALRQNGDGTANTAIGENALTGNTGGDYNVAIGSSALLANTDGEYNVAIGRQSQWKTTTGDQNISIGTSSLYNNTTGDKNIMVGYQAAYEAKAGNISSNIGIGEGAQYYMAGASNIGIGTYAVRGDATAGITGSYNIGMGESTLRIATSADNNIAIGKSALISHTTGDNNIAIGVESAYSGASKENITGSNNTFIGTYSGPTASNLTNATAIGYNASVGASNSLVLGASANVGIGSSSPGALLDVLSADGTRGGIHVHNSSTGYASIKFGDGTNNGELFYAPTGNCCWAVGTTVLSGALNADLILYAPTSRSVRTYANGAEVLTVLTGGNVGIGCNDPKYALHVIGDIASSATVRTTNALVTGAITACSDVRYKTNIVPLTNTLDKIMKLNGVSYNWKILDFPDKNFSSQQQIGVIAQELESVFPQLVFTDTDGYKSVDYSKLTPVLLEAIKELKRQLDDQQKQIEALKKINTGGSATQAIGQ